MKPTPFRLPILALLALLTVWVAVASAQEHPTMFPPVRGIHEMVGAANNFEVEAGYRLLTQGGNAIDAGVASVLAAGVTELSRFGLGGEMPLLIKMAGKPVVAISGVGVAPAKATVEFYSRRPPEPWEEPAHMTPIPGQGMLAAITPGVFDGLILALDKYGTKSFAEVAQPALEYAEQGFPMPEEFGGMLRSYQRILALWPASTKFFYPDGTPTPRGEIFREPALAKTLRELIAAEKKARGKRSAKLQAVRDLFYKGSIAKEFASYSENNGGLITLADLANYHADIEQPLVGTYRGYQIYKPGFWTQGPVMIEALNILEGYDLKAMGHNSPQYLHTVIEAVKLAFADRDEYYGDPKFSKIPEDILLSKEYAAERRKLIDPAHASLESRPGSFGRRINLPSTTASANGVAANDTTCVNVVDRDGNAFNATPSGAWLPSVIMGDTGLPLSSRLQSFVTTPGHPNQLQPGKRPRVTLSPTLVTKDGKLELIMSTPGGDNQDQALLQVLLNMLDFGMMPQEAVEAPRFQTEHFYSSFAGHEFTPGKLSLEGRFSQSTAQTLSALGHRVSLSGDWSNGSAPTVIWLHDGVLNGGADPRRARFIFGR
ncbi:MAG TPA: gamma-glutamyltransferase family protein [Bryobacteraceae bacterium]|nr:gamma-glutamyltransferase family protein [Bryobacteraceae bacterium]